jgi:D-cysteine desulfhydrase
MSESKASTHFIFDTSVEYCPPEWVTVLGAVKPERIPKRRLNLGRFPTPFQKVNIPGLEKYELGTIDIKRDDLSSFDLSGNKVRKLEFLLAEAVSDGHDSVITIGGIQSNHARATAVAARQLGLEPHLILRKRPSEDEEIGVTGNLLLDRLVGSKIYTISPSSYGQIGSWNLVQSLASQLRNKEGVEKRNPYPIPVGGSNEVGVFGYIECVREIFGQTSLSHYDHIVFACGSGGTAAGLAIGCRLAGYKGQVHAVGVCDSPECFYDHIREVATALGIDMNKYGPRVEDWCNIYDGQGIGYARSTKEELEYLLEFSEKTGILLDPVYSGKAMYYFIHKVLVESPYLLQKGQRLLFIHTGGTLGFYEKESELLPLLANKLNVQKFDISKL